MFSFFPNRLLVEFSPMKRDMENLEPCHSLASFITPLTPKERRKRSRRNSWNPYYNWVSKGSLRHYAYYIYILELSFSFIIQTETKVFSSSPKYGRNRRNGVIFAITFYKFFQYSGILKESSPSLKYVSHRFRASWMLSKLQTVTLVESVQL